jgi:hypothetical protein
VHGQCHARAIHRAHAFNVGDGLSRGKVVDAGPLGESTAVVLAARIRHIQIRFTAEALRFRFRRGWAKVSRQFFAPDPRNFYAPACVCFMGRCVSSCESKIRADRIGPRRPASRLR